MAIEFAPFCKLARTGLFGLIGMLSLSGMATAQQELVTTGSVIPLQHSTQYCQIYQIVNAPNGDTLFMDVCGGGGYGAVAGVGAAGANGLLVITYLTPSGAPAAIHHQVTGGQ